MEIKFTGDAVENSLPSIFLAGPTPRSEDVLSWRPQALELLKKHKFNGTVFVPENYNGKREYDVVQAAIWERKALHMANVIMFWVPRVLDTMPAFTTNVEFGYYIAKFPSHILYGRPDSAVKVRYLDWLYGMETSLKPQNNLEELVKLAINLAKLNHKSKKD